MKRIIKKLLNILLTPLVLRDYFAFANKIQDSRFRLSLSDAKPQIKDKTFATNYDRHYVYHTSWAARRLKAAHPQKHIDISSSLFFAGIVSSFIPIEFYDYRPADLLLSDLTCKQGDITKLPFKDDSVASLSCMHVVEHIGLGRYGDPIDPTGDSKAAQELARVLAPDGLLYFVVPVGEISKIEWNAHRIYSYTEALALFPTLKLKEFTLIPETSIDGGLIEHANAQEIVGQTYACGCFVFTK